jgi:purine-binding chemotaxis protein CheW
MTATLAANPTTAADAVQTPGHSLGGKYLTFRLDQVEFGLGILKVREINKIIDITAVPKMPPYMKGVINLRGRVVPVIDLRVKFGLPEAPYTDQTCIIIVNVGHQIGIVVDTVSEVLEIAGEHIDPPPTLSAAVDTTFILGMGKVGEAVKILLDVDRILNTDELGDVSAVLEQTSPNTRP